MRFGFGLCCATAMLTRCAEAEVMQNHHTLEDYEHTMSIRGMPSALRETEDGTSKERNPEFDRQVCGHPTKLQGV
jgi:hypothetical protein